MKCTVSLPLGKERESVAMIFPFVLICMMREFCPDTAIKMDSFPVESMSSMGKGKERIVPD